MLKWQSAISRKIIESVHKLAYSPIRDLEIFSDNCIFIETTLFFMIATSQVRASVKHNLVFDF